jgi:hypothetical protein
MLKKEDDFVRSLFGPKALSMFLFLQCEKQYGIAIWKWLTYVTLET